MERAASTVLTLGTTLQCPTMGQRIQTSNTLVPSSNLTAQCIFVVGNNMCSSYRHTAQKGFVNLTYNWPVADMQLVTLSLYTSYVILNGASVNHFLPAKLPAIINSHIHDLCISRGHGFSDTHDT